MVGLVRVCVCVCSSLCLMDNVISAFFLLASCWFAPSSFNYFHFHFLSRLVVCEGTYIYLFFFPSLMNLLYTYIYESNPPPPFFPSDFFMSG